MVKIIFHTIGTALKGKNSLPELHLGANSRGTSDYKRVANVLKDKDRVDIKYFLKV